jgi:phosphoribosylamine--glycine ligase
MNILLIGSGGREHALAWKIKQSPKCEKLFIAPGNAGTAALGENITIGIKDNQAVVDFAKGNNIGLVVVAPDDYLAQGMVDALMKAGVPAFGPTKAAAELEWSKAFAKSFMKRYEIPTARSKTFSALESAIAYAEEQPLPVVIKADGLALGKGVVIAESYDEAARTLVAFMEEDKFGESGKTVVIEEFLRGTEVSIHAFCDGTTAKLFPVSRDHKRVGDKDTGPNTGGMGTIAPVPVSSEFLEQVLQLTVVPVIQGMAEQETPYTGILFPGLMVTEQGTKVLEFNARFGDPETESYMRLLKSDLVDIMLACVEGRLEKQEVKWSDDSVVTVMLTSAGYPGAYEKGFPISGIEEAEKDSSVIVFHAGTALKEGKIVTAGGRVLGVSATGRSPEEAKKRAYEAVQKIKFEGAQYRTDIGAFWQI